MPYENVDADAEEVWILQSNGTVWMQVRAFDGSPRAVKVVGKGGKLRLTTGDRIRYQEGTTHKPHRDVFTNGTFIRSDADQQSDPMTATENALTDEDLLALLGTDTVDEFKEVLRTLSRLNLYRMKDLAEANENLPANRLQAIIEIRDELHPIWSGPTDSWEDIRKAKGNRS